MMAQEARPIGNVTIFRAKADRDAMRQGIARAGREIARAAVYLNALQSNRRSPDGPAPTVERFRHGQTIEQYDGAAEDAGDMGHRIVDACLLDRIREGGLLGVGPAALSRHSAGIWLRGLFHESGLMRSITMRGEPGSDGGDPSRPAAYEVSESASQALADYQGVLRRMETAVLTDGRDMTPRAKRRASHAVREIACWDRWPTGFTAREVQNAFDRLASLDGAEMGE